MATTDLAFCSLGKPWCFSEDFGLFWEKQSFSCLKPGVGADCLLLAF
jgi:hypothetical protein